MLTIRRAIIDDARALAVLAEHTFRETYSADNSEDEIELHCIQNFSLEIQSKELLDPKLITILAEEQYGDLVAFAQLRLESYTESINTNRSSELYRFYVSHQYHGRGLAQKMMKEILQIAKSKDSENLWLGVWEHNTKAIAFYQKIGFSEAGEHIFKLGQDPQRDLIMNVNFDV